MKKQSVSNQTDARGGTAGFRDPGSETERPNQSLPVRRHQHVSMKKRRL